MPWPALSSLGPQHIGLAIALERDVCDATDSPVCLFLPRLPWLWCHRWPSFALRFPPAQKNSREVSLRSNHFPLTLGWYGGTLVLGPRCERWSRVKRLENHQSSGTMAEPAPALHNVRCHSEHFPLPLCIDAQWNKPEAAEEGIWYTPIISNPVHMQVSQTDLELLSRLAVCWRHRVHSTYWSWNITKAKVWKMRESCRFRLPVFSSACLEPASDEDNGLSPPRKIQKTIPI